MKSDKPNKWLKKNWPETKRLDGKASGSNWREMNIGTITQSRSKNLPALMNLYHHRKWLKKLLGMTTSNYQATKSHSNNKYMTSMVVNHGRCSS
jgi:hypothetical protein